MLFRVLEFLPEVSRFRACDTVFYTAKPLAQIVCVFSLTPKGHDCKSTPKKARRFGRCTLSRDLKRRFFLATEGKKKSRTHISYRVISDLSGVIYSYTLIY